MKLMIPLLFSVLIVSALDAQETVSNPNLELIESAAVRVLEMQEEDGCWPYEGVYRVRRKIPVGYRIGGSSIVCMALLKAPLGESRARANQAIAKSVELILRELKSPLMEPSTQDRYDVRIWGHVYALELFCRLKQSDGFDELKERTELWIPKLIAAVESQEIDGGGWNYANQRSHAAFVTAPAIQALLAAEKLEFEVDQDVVERAAQALLDSRSKNGAYQYSGKGPRATEMPGSIARSALCESTLLMLGKGDPDQLRIAIDAFHEHWDELEKRRQKTGTHLPPYGVAPYYFYFGHRYVSQAIRFLPESEQKAEIKKFNLVLLKTKDDDNTWNDRVFDRSKAYGTAMSILALCSEEVETVRE